MFSLASYLKRLNPNPQQHQRRPKVPISSNSLNQSQNPSLFSPESASKSTTMSLIPSIFGDRRSKIFDPFEGFPFSSSLATNFPSSVLDSSAFANTRIDWKETPEAHIFKADLPGMNKQEIKVEVEEGRVLKISGDRSKEHEEKNDKWHRIERSSGKFIRKFRLPENAKVDGVKASMENGVLTVTVPKMEVKKPQVKAIDISG